MRVAILGAGFAGLATTYFLLYHSKGMVTVDLYDPLPIGGGASGTSSGLLHPYAGKHAKLAPDSDAKLNAVHHLIKEAAQALNQPLVLSKGILRPAVTPQQIEDFQKCAVIHTSDTEWWSKEKCEDQVPGLALPEKGGGLFAKHGLTLDVQAYLSGLWQACALLGSQFHQTSVVSEAELKGYDRIVFATGHAIKAFPPLSDLPVELIKGQVLILKWPQNIPPLPFSLVSEGYVVMQKGGKECVAGSTYERTFHSAEPDLEVAKREVKKKVVSFFPSLEGALVVECRAGIRAASKKTHLPLVGKLSDKVWFLTGLGSKGLLYHGWIGDHFARALLKNDRHHIPKEVLHTFS